MPVQTTSRYKGKLTHFTDVRLSVTEINVSVDAKEYTTKQGEYLTGIAGRELGNKQYYWIIADINNILNPYVRMLAGQKLLLPTGNALNKILDQR